MKRYKGHPYKIINNRAVLFSNIPNYIAGIASPSLCYLYSDEVENLEIVNCNNTTDSRYMKAKARQHNRNITDKEIIINLEKEIEYYRNKLQNIQEEKMLINKPKDTLEYEITKIYADDKIIQTIIDYKYKE